VLLIQDLEFGGTQRFALNLMKHLDRSIFHPELWVLRGGTQMLRPAGEAGITPLWISRGKRVGIHSLFQLAGSLLRRPPDILYTLTVVPNIWGRMLGRITKVPVIVSGWRSLFPRQHERLLWRLCDRTICNASALKRIMVESYGVDPGHISVIPNGIDSGFFHPGRLEESTDPLILFVGRLVPEKNPMNILEAFRMILNLFPSARLCMIGDGPLRGRVETFIRVHRLQHRVSLQRGAADIRPYMAKAWVLAVSSVQEASPNVILEAMASGLPVIASRVGGIPEIVQHGRTGFLFEPYNPESLASFLTTIFRNEPLRQSMSAAARKRVMDCFTLERMVRETERVLLETVQARKGIREIRDDMNNIHQHRFPFKIAYVLLWFPKPTETFIFHEIVRLRRMGLPLKVFTLYGAWKRDLSPEMTSTNTTARMGISSLIRMPFDIGYWLKRSPLTVKSLLLETASRPRAGLEKTGENLWAFLCGFSLARRFMEEEIRHIHAGWAAGPATAAWVASRLTGIPFSFSARAWDIYPPDGALAEKIRDCSFVRSETRAAVAHLERFARGHEKKLQVIYNGLTLPSDSKAPVLMKPPFRLLAIGRFVGKKGFPLLLHSCRILLDQGLDFRLTIAGAGPLKRRVQSLCKGWNLESIVSFPGFVPHNQVRELLNRSDILIVPSVVHRSGDRDGIPTVIMEALSARVPVVATNVAGISEVIRDGLTGRLVPPDNPQSLARAIGELTADRSRAIEMAEEGRKLVLRQFDPEQNCRALLHLIQTSLSGSAEQFTGDFEEGIKG